jgi:PAS domain-containing protein
MIVSKILSESLELLVDRMPMGIAYFDTDLILQRCNPTWASFIEQYSPTTAPRV